MNTNKIAIFFPLDFIDGIIHRYVATVLQSLSHLHMNTCIEIFKKRITKQLPECSTEEKMHCSLFYKVGGGKWISQRGKGSDLSVLYMGSWILFIQFESLHLYDRII